jgi:hypothetical protein
LTRETGTDKGTWVKQIIVLTLLGLLGFVAAGCGTGATSASPTITVTGTGTLTNLDTGTLVQCKGGPGAKVPVPGHDVDESAGEDTLSRTRTGASLRGAIRLERLRNARVRIACTPFH